MDKPIKQTYDLKASVAAVWRALTDVEEIQQWSGANAFFVAQAGALYTLWDGQIGGKILEIVPQKKLVMTWKPENWTREDSVVTFTLTPTKSGTRIDLLHENVEEDDYNGTDEGWEVYYLGEIKRMLEARAVVKPAAKAKKKTGARKVKSKSKRTR